MKNFKSLVLAIIGMLALIVCASMFTACTQDEYLPTYSYTYENIDSQDMDGEYIATRGMMTHAVYNIPSGVYGIAQKYKNAYSHINQYDNSATSTYPNGWPGGTSNPGNCSWTNYTMAVGCVGRAEGTITDPNDYKLDKARRLKKYVYDHLPLANRTYLNASSIVNITNLYANVYDNGVIANIQRSAYNKNSYETIAYDMITHLINHESPIVYLGALSNTGHYFTVVSIVWTGSFSSSEIWYCDSTQGNTGDPFPASGTTSSFRLCMNLKDFIDTAKQNSNTYANIWFISPV